MTPRASAMILRALIVDDEPLARSRLARLLEALDGVRVVGEAADGDEALVRIREDQPDLVFLDIRMPGIDGIAVARATQEPTSISTSTARPGRAPEARTLTARSTRGEGPRASDTPDLGIPRPAIVFTTAYDEHAIEAFDVAAVDYLLKPIQRAKLERALERVRARVEPAQPREPTSAHLAQRARDRAEEGERERARDHDQPGAHPNASIPNVADVVQEVLRASARSARVTATEGGSIHLFDAREITRFHASAKYTVFWHQDREYLVEESLSELERRLTPFGFFRAHRGELVSLRHVRTLRQQPEGHTIVLTDGQQARVSRRLITDLKKALSLP